MALGTNYARTPGVEQMSEMDLRFAKQAVRQGLTREQYQASTSKPEFREQFGLDYDAAVAALAKSGQRKANADDPVKLNDKCAAWLRTADSSGELSWLVGSKVVSGKVVRECRKNGWATDRTASAMEITDAGRAALAERQRGGSA